MKTFGYWSDATGIDLSDQHNSWIQAIPLGKWNHPVYGALDYTKEKAQAFLANIKANARSQDLPIDYEHGEDNSKGTKAAGWVKDAEVRDDGLYLSVDWTDEAAESIKKKEFKYFSPTLADEWEHPSTGQKIKNVLFGGALTNRPFLKGILPVNLSELFAEEPKKQIISLFSSDDTGFDPSKLVESLLSKLSEPSGSGTGGDPKGDNMDPKELRKLLGLAETATDEEVTKKLSELVNPPKSNPYEGKSAEEILAALINQGKNPGLTALTDLVKAQHDQLKMLSEQRAELEADQRIKAFEEGINNPNVELTDDLRNQLKQILLSSPKEIGDEVLEAYKATFNLGLIDVSKQGWQTRAGMSSATERFMGEVAEAQRLAGGEAKLSFADACTKIARENPTLARAYHEEAYVETGSY